jgi:hypothetical protein
MSPIPSDAADNPRPTSPPTRATAAFQEEPSRLEGWPRTGVSPVWQRIQVQAVPVGVSTDDGTTCRVATRTGTEVEQIFIRGCLVRG